MINIFKKYNNLTDEQKNDLEDLYIIHQLYKKLEEYKDLGLTNTDKEIVFNKVKECLKLSNINIMEIITRLFEMLECIDITIYNINDLETDEIIELLSETEKDFKTKVKKKDILFAINTNRFYCFLIRYDTQYMLVCEKEDGTQYQRKFKTLFDLAYYISRKFLQEYGEIYI